MPGLRLPNVDSVTVEPGANGKQVVTLNGVDEATVLQFINIDQAVSFYGKANLIKALNIEQKEPSDEKL